MSFPNIRIGGLALAALVAAAPAAAVEQTRITYPNAAAWCQGALPAFSGTLRARPLAIMNEGNANAFVTCSLPGGDSLGAPQATAVGVYVINRGAAARTVACTLVNGYESVSGPDEVTSYTLKSTSVAPGSSEFFVWEPEELPGPPTAISNPNFSCQLPPGTGIAYLYFTYPEDVGQ